MSWNVLNAFLELSDYAQIKLVQNGFCNQCVTSSTRDLPPSLLRVSSSSSPLRPAVWFPIPKGLKRDLTYYAFWTMRAISSHRWLGKIGALPLLRLRPLEKRLGPVWFLWEQHRTTLFNVAFEARTEYFGSVLVSCQICISVKTWSRPSFYLLPLTHADFKQRCRFPIVSHVAVAGKFTCSETKYRSTLRGL